MNIFGGLFGWLTGRADHVPEADVPEVLATANAMRDPSRSPLTEEDWRAVEATQVLYLAGRVVRQATPKQAGPGFQGFLGGALPILQAVAEPVPDPSIPHPETEGP